MQRTLCQDLPFLFHLYQKRGLPFLVALGLALRTLEMEAG